VVEIDGHTGASTPEEFEAAAAKVFTDDRPVLLVDTLEAYQALESWLRDRFLPRLPAAALVVLAGRTQPGSRFWCCDISSRCCDGRSPARVTGSRPATARA
jgi:hypothetical protein